MIDPVEFERKIDDRFAAMKLRPGMFGTVDGLEFSCAVLIEFYIDLVLKPDDTFEYRNDFQAHARKIFPKRPGPMTFGTWLTDPEWGCDEAKNPGERHHHWAGQQIVEFYISWKAELKTRFAKN